MATPSEREDGRRWSKGTGFSRPEIDRIAQVVTVVAGIVVFLAVWEGTVRVTGVRTVFLPSPVEVSRVLFRRAPSMYPHAVYTALEVGLGLAVGVIGGLVLALVMALSQRARLVLYPYLLAIRVVPLVVLAPLLVIALGTTLLTRVLLAAIMTFFPVTVAALEGLLATPTTQLELLRSVDAPAWRRVVSIRFPNALPSVFTGLKLAGPLAVEGVIIAEFLASTRGIGFKLLETARKLQTARLFAYLVVLIAFGLTVFGLIAFVERILRWDDRGDSLADQLGTGQSIPLNAWSTESGISVAVGVGALAVWSIVASIVPYADLYLPKPTGVAVSFVATPGLFLQAGLSTFTTFVTGWSIGVLIGLTLGVMLALIPWTRSVTYPYLVGVRVMPQIAVAPLLLIWFGISFEAAIVMVGLSTFFPVTIGAATGLSSMPAEHHALLQSVDASGWRPLIAVRFRHAIPSLFVGLKLSTVTGLAGTVIAEWFVAEGGLGVLVLQGMTDFVPRLTYAASVALFILGGGLFLTVSAAQRVVSW